jgi:hypothetical protein
MPLTVATLRRGVASGAMVLLPVTLRVWPLVMVREPAVPPTPTVRGLGTVIVPPTAAGRGVGETLTAATSA